ncbi:MAG: zinc ribbon domain-containing protein [Dehalococcoidia bacterium]|nr:zinc ribbon domain-containing protein [Dehalococcoidia bacterium]
MSDRIEKMLSVKGLSGATSLAEAVFATPEAVLSVTDRQSNSEVRRWKDAAAAIGCLQEDVRGFLQGYDTGGSSLYTLGNEESEALCSLGDLLDFFTARGAARLTTVGQLAAYKSESIADLVPSLVHLVAAGLVEGGAVSEDDPLWLSLVGDDLWSALSRGPLKLDISAIDVSQGTGLAARVVGGFSQLYLLTFPRDNEFFIRPVAGQQVADLLPWAWSIMATPFPAISTPDRESNPTVRSGTARGSAPARPVQTTVPTLAVIPPPSVSRVGEAGEAGRSCPKCQAPLVAGVKFCMACGATAPVVALPRLTFCGQCGARAVPGQKFCAGCGKPI